MTQPAFVLRRIVVVQAVMSHSNCLFPSQRRAILGGQRTFDAEARPCPTRGTRRHSNRVSAAVGHTDTQGKHGHPDQPVAA